MGGDGNRGRFTCPGLDCGRNQIARGMRVGCDVYGSPAGPAIRRLRTISSGLIGHFMRPAKRRCK